MYNFYQNSTVEGEQQLDLNKTSLQVIVYEWLNNRSASTIISYNVAVLV